MVFQDCVLAKSPLETCKMLKKSWGVILYNSHMCASNNINNNLGYIPGPSLSGSRDENSSKNQRYWSLHRETLDISSISTE